jgi:histidinol-phosphate/aromatic aminotransferase/cobyric acid decarboxylase-like protein
MASMPGLGDALRITIGTRREGEALLAALERPA